MIVEQSKQIIAEVNKAFMGKTDIVEKVLMTIYAGGHVLLEDCPGVGKTTLAMAFSRVLGLSSKRIQFTPDTLPSDITGFTMFNREKEQQTVSCCLQTRSTVRHRRRNQHFLRSWKNIPSVWMVIHTHCQIRLCALPHRIRWDLQVHSRFRNHRLTVLWYVCR